MLSFKQFVTEFPKDWEREPFCPFDGPQKMGYCDGAYSDACFNCDEARGAYDKYCEEQEKAGK